MNSIGKHLTIKNSQEKDWDVMRDILLEVEKLCFSTWGSLDFTLRKSDLKRTQQAFILYEKNFIQGMYAISNEGDSLKVYGLTREGREVLGSMRNQPVWASIKNLAQQKSIELTVSTIRNLSTFALKTAFVSPHHIN